MHVYKGIWAAFSENMPSNMCKMRRFRSSCSCAKCHLGLYSPFVHSVVSSDYVSGQWGPWADCAHARADLGLHCPHMPEDTFSHGEIYFPLWCVITDGQYMVSINVLYSAKIDILLSKKVLRNWYIIIKCGTWQSVRFQLVSRSWTGSKVTWFLLHRWINVTNINLEIP